MGVKPRDVPEVGTRFVWRIPSAKFGPVYMIVKKVIMGQRPRVIFTCWGPDGVPYRRPHRSFLPLSEFVCQTDWTEADLMKARLRHNEGTRP